MNDTLSRAVHFEYIPRETTTILPSQVRNGFVFAPRYHSKKKPGDANTFQSRARQFCRYYGLRQPFIFDNDGNNDSDHYDDQFDLAARRGSIIEAVDSGSRPLDVVAYFGHGGRRGLISAGFLGERGLREFANALVRNANRRLVVILYACRTGHPGSFADQLCGALIARGVHATVFAHETSGHTTNNPSKRRYPGGDYVIEPGSIYYSEWLRRLWETDLWLRYPFMEPNEIMRVIRA